ncbi:MAG: trehalose-6-phosphate synthase [Actinobacteria bacterium]|nr:trehalose-6-phosphate synthase [Actinomycetota bacterium]
MARPVVLVSNRGPLSFARDGSGRLVARRGAGGLVSGLAPLVEGEPGNLWMAAALSDDDRAAAREGTVEAEGLRVHLVDVDARDHALAYDVVCNATLWFILHGMVDGIERPVYDRSWWAAWSAYRRVNEAFATAVAEAAPDGAAVLVQDYHLALVAPTLVARRPDVRVVHFSHTPFAGPEILAALPTAARAELVAGMAASHACGFHTQRWAGAFEASVRAFADGAAPRTFVAPLAPDPGDLLRVAGSDACAQALTRLEATLAGRALLARVDRIEPTKNLVRGFLAFDALLESHPQWRERVVFGAFVYPSRENVPVYRSYRDEVERVVARVNERWATPGWTPVLYDPSDDFAGSVAALRRADVLLVNPVRDGLNLVAKEGAIVNERDGVTVLSTEAGAYDELAGDVLPVHPFDVEETAAALDRALSTPSDERTAKAAAVRARAAARTPADWLSDQLAAAG